MGPLEPQGKDQLLPRMEAAVDFFDAALDGS